jgi:glycerate kinase
VNVLIAMDSFKGSLTSQQAGKAVFNGLKEACRSLYCPMPHTTLLPLADGGEGTVAALMEGLKGTYHTVTVCDPLGKPVQAQYGIVPGTNDGKAPLAVIEMAAAAGLNLVPEEKRNPLHTSTYGVGQMIVHAMEQGCRTFLIGIGGSGTNDAGIGMLSALGFVFTDKHGNKTGTCGQDLERIANIQTDTVHPLLTACTFRIASDVTNPLTGPNGAAAVYGPQKGADAATVQRLDRGLKHFARVASLAEAKTPEHLDRVPGAGAAGGLGYAFLRFLDGSLEPGADLVIDAIGLREHARSAHLIVTGEGRLDSQTSMGKAPAAVARLAQAYEKPIVALCGSVDPHAAAAGLFDRAIAVTPPGGSFEDAAVYLQQAAAVFFKEHLALI